MSFQKPACGKLNNLVRSQIAKMFAGRREVGEREKR